MSNKTYYSVMKNDSLILDWTTNSQDIVKTLKQEDKGVLVSLSGDSNISIDDLMDIGALKIYEQESMDEFMNEKTCGDVYLDNAFTLIDDLEAKYKVKDSKYSFEIYLATALSKKMKLSQKMSWLLMTAFLASRVPKLKSVVFNYPGKDWKPFDSEFFDKLIEKPYDQPFENGGNIEVYFESKPYSTYNYVARAFQDLAELCKVDKNNISLNNLQSSYSFKLIRMSFELLNYFS